MALRPRLPSGRESLLRQGEENDNEEREKRHEDSSKGNEPTERSEDTCRRTGPGRRVQRRDDVLRPGRDIGEVQLLHGRRGLRPLLQQDTEGREDRVRGEHDGLSRQQEAAGDGISEHHGRPPEGARAHREVQEEERQGRLREDREATLHGHAARVAPPHEGGTDPEGTS